MRNLFLASAIAVSLSAAFAASNASAAPFAAPTLKGGEQSTVLVRYDSPRFDPDYGYRDRPAWRWWRHRGEGDWRRRHDRWDDRRDRWRGRDAYRDDRRWNRY